MGPLSFPRLPLQCHSLSLWGGYLYQLHIVTLSGVVRGLLLGFSRRLSALVTLSVFHLYPPGCLSLGSLSLLASLVLPHLQPGAVAFFPWPFASVLWHIGWSCSFASFGRSVAMVTVLIFLGSCCSPSLLGVVTLSHSCASSCRLRLLSGSVSALSTSLSFGVFLTLLFSLRCWLQMFIVSLLGQCLTPIPRCLGASSSGSSLLFLGLWLSCRN